MIDDDGSVLCDSDSPTHQRDIEALPLSRLARLFRIGCDESIHATRVMARWFLNRIVFNLNLIPPAQIYAAVGALPAVELYVQFEIPELGTVDQLRSMAGAHESSILH